MGNGTELRACPACKEQHRDWEDRLRGLAGEESRYGGGYRSA
jgi:hypothetical protein